ncbi:hypothetical protein PYH37_001343 [Sinorhizobium numidicum]|uniref:Uncharacterized protein n=1 Tax=Sinorhizobium numidicum TaxID=680248 RepID=A0ABY8CSH0_9HYPH|nr:hypothetical protein [Sinorhizobium numidicum]WEX73976.1 hypothetical protein PYH37_001343 [Sinorhizobium numidicum]WEX79961.1 hypothetical protein PYH38_001344 [Sinorhizobium numidicum]
MEKAIGNASRRELSMACHWPACAHLAALQHRSSRHRLACSGLTREPLLSAPLFARHSGRDEIFDFELDRDIIQLAGYGYEDFADLLPNISDDANGNAVVHLNGTVDQVTLLGVQTADLSAANFVFSADLAFV